MITVIIKEITVIKIHPHLYPPPLREFSFPRNEERGNHRNRC